MTLECCNEEMLIAGRWCHCRKCGMKLIKIEYEDGVGNDKRIVTELLNDIISSDGMTWKKFGGIMHEIWREAYYEDYEGNYPEDWCIERRS